MPTVLLILAHPDKRSFGGALADSYAKALQKGGCEVKELHLPAMAFEATPQGRPPELEADLIRARELIMQASHIVLVYPTWLGTMPARLKGFFERAFSGDFAFKFKPGKLMPSSFLRGRSADVFVTMDTPPLVYRWVLGAPGHRMVRHSIFGPAGIRPIRFFTFGPLGSSSDGQRQRWLAETAARATAIAQKLASSAHVESATR